MELSEPCFEIACRHHVRSNARGRQADPESFPAETCSLRLAGRGAMTLETIGDVMGLTRERIRQVEVKALLKLRRILEEEGYRRDVLTHFGGS